MVMMIDKLLEWVPNLEGLLKWVSLTLLKKTLIQGGFVIEDFQDRHRYTADGDSPYWPTVKFDIYMTDKKTSFKRENGRLVEKTKVTHHLHVSCETTNGYSRLILALVRRKFPQLDPYTITVYSLQHSGLSMYLKMGEGEPNICIDAGYLFTKDWKRAELTLWNSVKNTIAHQRGDKPQLSMKQAEKIIMTSQAYFDYKSCFHGKTKTVQPS